LASPIVARVQQAKSTAIMREGLAQGHGEYMRALLSNLATAIENVDFHFALYQIALFHVKRLNPPYFNRKPNITTKSTLL
jgi:hypothetical protein